MRISIARVISIMSSVFILVAVVFVFFTAPYIGSAYLQITSRFGSELPLITKDFSLAFLGNAKDPFSIFPERAVWAWCLWVIFLFWPIALVVWAVRAPDFERSLAKWCLGMIAYLSLISTVAAIVFAGLVMPFTRL